MRDVSKLKFIGSTFCNQYQSQVKFYIDEAHASGKCQLVVVYENGEPDFMAGIPDEWADENVQGLHLLADEKSELALSRMGGAGARLWQSNALCLVEGPPSASASSSEIAYGLTGAPLLRRATLSDCLKIAI
jgi:hypothetical protein